MIVAFLFNSDDPRFDGYYGPPIRNLVFATGVLQASDRHLKLAQGDILLFSFAKTTAHYRELAEATYFAGTWSTVEADKIRSTYLSQTVCVWLVQNMTRTIAERLDKALLSDDAYLGVMEVDYTLPSHWLMFRQSMVPYCRVQGHRCTRFYSMGNEDVKDDYEVAELVKVGFTTVDWEDRGAHQTIFDDFDTLEHFVRLKNVQISLGEVLPEGEDEASELVMMLEDLSPKLFNSLSSAVRAIASAETEEDYAQAGISARRYVEQLADALFPPSKAPFNGRDVSEAKFKNRLWAFIDKSLPESTDKAFKKQSIGKEADRLIDSVNTLIHGRPDKLLATRVFADLAKLTITLVQLDPEAARQPYRAFEEKMMDYFREHLKEIQASKDRSE